MTRKTAVRCGRSLAAGYLRLIQAIALYTWGATWPLAACAVVGTCAATAAFFVVMMMLPLHTDLWGIRDDHMAYLLSRCFPLAVVPGVCFAIGWACATRRPLAGAIPIVLALSGLSYAVSSHAVPRFGGRAERAIHSGVYGVFTGPGLKLPSGERQRRIGTSPYRGIRVSSRWFSYSAGSMACAPVVLSAFIVCVCVRRRLAGFAAACTTVGAVLVYTVILALVDNVRWYPMHWRIIETMPFNWFPVVIWIPNALFALATMVVLSRGGRARTLGHNAMTCGVALIVSQLLPRSAMRVLTPWTREA